MSIDVATFRARFPEFSDDTEYSDARIQIFIDDAAEDIGTDENRWCNKYDRAQAYLAAHYLYTATSAEAGDASAKAGPISSKSAGGVSVGRAVIAKDRSDQDSFYSTSSYGQQFLIIRNSCFVGVMVVNQL